MARGDHDLDGDRHPPIQLTIWSVIALAIVAVAALFTVRLEHQPETTRDYPPRPLIPDGRVVLLPGPEIDDEYLPCDDCHGDPDRETGPIPRELEVEHDDMELAHGNLWCLHCHDSENPERLRLADASRIELDDSWQLCGQCHGKKIPEWRAGVHGKTYGHWRGDRQYDTCVACHDPHSPPTRALAPKPRPRRPDEIALRTKNSGGE